jgi:hypothetical protein
MAQTAIDISSLLPWSEPREIPNLRRQVRSAPVTEAFWCLWRDRKTELKAAGISIGTWPKESKNFMASWWTPLGAGVEAEREASAELSRAAAPVGDFEPPCPEGLKYYPFQKAGIQFCVRKFSRGEGGVLIGDQPGLGKSCQAVGVMNCNPEIKRVLVFTKASLKNFWAREMKRWSVRKLEIGMASGQRWPATEIVIANYDIAAKWAKRMRMLDWDLVILDESQACFPYETQVETNLGRLTIGEIVEQKLPVFVLSCNLSSHNLQFQRVTTHIKLQRSNRIVTIRHERGKITCTEDHKIWTDRGYVAAATLSFFATDNFYGQLSRGTKLFMVRDNVYDPHTSEPQMEVSGQTQNFHLERSRVVSVEIHQPASIDSDRRSVGKDQFVYCLEVEKNHNFFADGILVANCKNPKAQRTKAIMGDKKAGLAPLRARYRLCCSGTPIENRPIELFTTLNFLDPARWRSYWGYAKRYCGMVSNGWGMDVSGASNLNELQIILRETGVLIRRLKAEVLRELPAKTRVVVELEGDEMGAALAQENAVSSRYAAELEQAQAGIELARALESDDAFKAAVKALAAAHNIPFTEMAKVRHQTALAKLPAAIEAIKEDLDEFSVKQVIFAHHSDVIAGLRSAFPGSVAITGETPAEDRQAIVDRFQSEPGCGPFFGSIRACGEGITLTAARLCSFIEIDWSPAKMEQASDRIHRIGQRDNVLIKHLVVRGSIDAWIIQTILAKQEIIEKALDTDPGEWATEPVLVARHEPIGKRKEIAEEALLMTTEQNLAIHAELKRLDEAGSGFSKVDAAIGRALAGLPVLTAKQAVLAKRLCLRQIGEIKL